MDPVRVGILGLGTVGGGTVSLLRRNAEPLKRRLGRALEVTRVAVKDPSKPRPVDLEGIEVGTDAESICTDPNIDIVIELVGGVDNAEPLVRKALEHGKPVVTANKALLAERGNELFRFAGEQGVDLAFEAAVAGGIPIIKALREGLAGNRIESVHAIANGTANYMLSRMRTEGMEFAGALQEAQDLGYAELDPTFDVDGIDAAHKLALVAAVAFGAPINYEALHIEGIRSITREDILYADELGYRIKLLAITKNGPGGIELRVHPTLVPQDTMLASVEGVFNAVQVVGDAVGPTLYYGPGAGADPTASAVVGDLVDVARTLGAPPEYRVPYLGFRADGMQEPRWAPVEEVETEYYLRMQAQDQPGVLAQVTRILSEEGISIEAIRQKEPRPGDTDVPVVLVTHTTKERAMRKAVAAIDGLDVINGPSQLIRLEEVDAV
ncbi:homoserine dehydrogenase [Thiohalorhabdus denitrificans]|uniref:Homoserine dehydrogenase n=1 Tax=Thiohalorhabdus denitrificans TaxID=381306 RepID=A0A0P9CQM3_9GAMM|nr:homoserine dehydrogenase [Thiohalorhabdus denitrificans]KPV41615.1 homoserine dehydrogenase [Thiohalorhabdus denitrificans]SCY57271.1 homoserine dehydrogenase [Thiohalorhabdus denitrificans]